MAVTMASLQPVSAARTSTKALEQTKPTVTGASPALMAERQAVSRYLSLALATQKVSTQDGPHMAAVATSAPANPAAFQPTSVVTRKLGPGAAWAMANRAAKSWLVIQWFTSTAWRWISGITAFAPPNATSDRPVNWIARAKSVSEVFTPCASTSK